MSTIGTLEIQLLANVAGLQKSMDVTKNLVSSTMKDVQIQIDAAKSAVFAFTGAMVGVKSFDAFKSIFDSVVESRIELKRLSEQTGASVESLGAIAGVAKLTGSNIGEVGSAMNKLQKNLATSTEESKGAAQALDALGINFKSFVKESPDKQMLEVAKAMAGFNDGSGKSAAAMMLFGKTGAQLLPMLKELADKETLVGKTTTESTEQAEKYEQNLMKLAKASSEWKRTMVDDLLPTLLDVTTAMVKARQEAGFLASIKAGVDTLGNDLFDWQGNAERKGIKWIADDLESLKAARDRITVDVFGMKESLGKEIDLKTLQLAQAQANYFKLTSGASGGGRGFVNPKNATSDLDPTLGAAAKKDPLPTGVNEGLTILNGLKTKYEQLTGAVSEYAQIVRQLDALKSPVEDSRRKEILDVARLVEAKQQLIAATKANISSYVEQANKQADQDNLIRQFIESSNEAKNQILLQTDALGMDSDALASHNALMQIDVQMRRLMVGATGDTFVQLQLLSDHMKGGVSQAMDALKAKQDALNGSWGVGAKNALVEYQKNVSNVASFTQNAFTNAFKGMEDALVNFVTTGKLDFASLVNSMIADLVRYQIQQSIMKPLTAAMGSSGGIMSLLGFASGGQPPVGVPSIVGEKGPELFVPSTAGTIVPNHALGVSSGVTVNQPIVINANNASAETVGQIRAMMPGLLATNSRVITAVVQQAFAKQGMKVSI